MVNLIIMALSIPVECAGMWPRKGTPAGPPGGELLMAQLKVQQKRGLVGLKANQRETLRSLGLKRIGDVVVKEDRPEIRGMINTVRHLVTFEEVE